ncbi:MAG: ROK family protein [Candidatus Bathyarchaeia archaeon]
MEKKYGIGVDLGGTWLRIALFRAEGNIVGKIQRQVNTSSEYAISRQIIALIRSLCDRNAVGFRSLQGVGIVSAGPLDVKRGVLVSPVNLPFREVPLRVPVAEELGVPVCLVNDCSGAVLGEWRFGVGKGLDNLVYVAIGTGIGGGAIVDGHLLLGKDGNAVEIGHFTIDYEGRLKCGCGRSGHWEAYCSGRNMPNFVRMRLEEVGEEEVKESLLFKSVRGDLSCLSSEDLFNAAKSGDKLSVRLVEEIGILNAVGFANIVDAYDPSLVTVGGSVALRNQDLVLPPIERHVEECALNRVPEIRVTPLGEDAGIYGAAAAVLGFGLNAES